MIRFLPHNQIHKDKWEECIARSYNGIAYARSWYLDIVSPGWEALVLDDYSAVMPLPVNRKYGVKYVYPPFFTQQLGVFSTGKLGPDDINTFLKSVPEEVAYYEINLNTFNKVSDHTAIKNLTHELDLIPSYDVLFSGYNENTRRNLKRSLKSELVLDSTIKPNDVMRLFRENRGRQIGKFTDVHYKILEKLCTIATVHGKLQIRGVRTAKGKLCAGAIFIESNGKVIFLFSGSDNEAKENGAMTFLVDRFISENSQRNLVLDFEGSNDPNLARFYKGFGSKECVYLQVRRNNLPWFLKIFKK